MIHATLRRVLIAACCLSVSHAMRLSAVGVSDTWTQIASFNGSGEKPEDTAPFTTHGGKVRFTFTVQPNSSGPVPFLSKMYPKGSPATANELRRTQCIDCKGKQTDDLGSVRAGSYYLHIITSRPWTLVVEEAK
jgi:hypothetical protein